MMKWRLFILSLMIPALALAANPAWLQGWTATRPSESSYTYPTNGMCVLFRFDTATTTNNLAEATNNFNIVAGRGTTVVLGEGLVTTNLTGNCGTYALTALAATPETTDNITVNAWIKWKTLAERDTLLYGNSLILRQSGTAGEDARDDFNFYLYGAPTLLTASNVCSTSEWQMLTFVSDKTNILVYKNGALAVSAAVIIDIVHGTTPRIGSDGTTDTAQFICGELGLWSVAWSPAEITNHFTETKGTKL